MDPFIQRAARIDILAQYSYYLDQGVPVVAQRFLAAVHRAVDEAVAMPHAGAPRRTVNPLLAGLCTWPAKGFREHRVYYLVRHDRPTVVRVLHDKRDTAAILRGQRIEGAPEFG